MRLAIRRHMMPAVTLVAFISTVLPAGHPAFGHLALGTALILVYWMVEWIGIEGTFEGREHAPSKVGRAIWLAGLILCVLDTLWLHWTPFQGIGVRAAGITIFLSGIALRYWAMRTLSSAFSYDLKVSDEQQLIRNGPYRILRHPAYTGLLLWSIGFALWNPSLPGLVVLVAATLREISARVRLEEKMLAAHFGVRWDQYVEATWAVVPMVW